VGIEEETAISQKRKVPFSPGFSIKRERSELLGKPSSVWIPTIWETSAAVWQRHALSRRSELEGINEYVFREKRAANGPAPAGRHNCSKKTDFGQKPGRTHGDIEERGKFNGGRNVGLKGGNLGRTFYKAIGSATHELSSEGNLKYQGALT